MFDAIGVREFWPKGSNYYTEDDFFISSELGLAVVSHGLGAIGGQGKPASKIALWSIVAELENTRSIDLSKHLHRGFLRAEASVSRLSAGWPKGLIRPSATMAVLAIRGEVAFLASVGGCLVSRFRDGQFDQFYTTTEQADYYPRALGQGHELKIHKCNVNTHDRFLIATPSLYRMLSKEEISKILSSDWQQLKRHMGSTDLMTALVEQYPYGSATYCIINMRHSSKVEFLTSSRPPISWFYDPAQPTAGAPDNWSGGPDQRWFDEVYSSVMGDD